MGSPVEAASESRSLITTDVSFSTSLVNSLPSAFVKNTEEIPTLSEPLPLMERGCEMFGGISLLSRELDVTTNN